MKRMGMIAAVAAMLAPAAARADDSGFHAGVGYTNYSVGDFEDIGALTLRLGYRANQYVGVEAEYSNGVIDGDFGGLDADVEASGAFIVGYLPVGERIDVFARAGYSAADLFATGSCGSGCTTTASTDEEGVSYGIGVVYQLTDRFRVRGEYTRAEGDFRDTDAFGVSGAYQF